MLPYKSLEIFSASTVLSHGSIMMPPHQPRVFARLARWQLFIENWKLRWPSGVKQREMSRLSKIVISVWFQKRNFQAPIEHSYSFCATFKFFETSGFGHHQWNSYKATCYGHLVIHNTHSVNMKYPVDCRKANKITKWIDLYFPQTKNLREFYIYFSEHFFWPSTFNINFLSCLTRPVFL